jgi:hypothetical protein
MRFSYREQVERLATSLGFRAAKHPVNYADPAMKVTSSQMGRRDDVALSCWCKVSLAAGAENIH